MSRTVQTPGAPTAPASAPAASTTATGANPPESNDAAISEAQAKHEQELAARDAYIAQLEAAAAATQAAQPKVTKGKAATVSQEVAQIVASASPSWVLTEKGWEHK